MQESPRHSSRWFIPALATITAAYLTLAFSHIAELPLLDPDEPRYASAGRTMAREGTAEALLVPQFNGEPRINKPPLFYWLVALSDKLTAGPDATETSSRLPSVLMGFAMLLGTVWLGTRVFGRATGLLGGLILLSMPLFLALSRTCITDMTFSSFLCGAFAWLLLAVTGIENPKKAGWIAAVLLGLAVLTKAHCAISLVLAVIIFRAFELPRDQRPRVARAIVPLLFAAILLSAGAIQCEFAARRVASAEAAERVAEPRPDDDDEAPPPAPKRHNIWETCDNLLNKSAIFCAFAVVAILFWMALTSEKRARTLPRMWPFGLALALLMGLWWYALLIVDQGWERFVTLITFEVSQRLTGSAGHREGIYFYLYMLPAVLFSWSIGLPAAIARAWPRAILPSEGETPNSFSPLPSGGEGPGVRGQRTEEGSELRAQSATPQPSPLTPHPHDQRADTFLLAWLLGVLFFFSIPGAKLSTYLLPCMPAVALLLARACMNFDRAGAWVTLTRTLAVLLALALLLFPIYGRWLPKDVPTYVNAHTAELWVLSIILAVVLPGLWLLGTFRRARATAVALSCSSLLIIYLMLPFIIGKLKHRSTKDAALAVKEILRDTPRIESLGVAVESLSYYLDRPVIDRHWTPLKDKAHPEKMIFDILGDKEPAAIFIDKRFYPRLLGRTNDLVKQTKEEVRQNLPEELEYIYSDHSLLVVRNKVK